MLATGGRQMGGELDELRDAVPGARLLTDQDQMEAYRRDQTPR